MFRHQKELMFPAKPDKPNPVYANMLQELIGGAYGEMSVMLQYMFQGWNCRGPAKYRDMLLDIGTEEIAHVEMLATMVARLLEGASPEDQESLAGGSEAVKAVLGGTNPKDAILAAAMNPQHTGVSGTGAMPADSVGYPWNGRYVIASGNLMADFRANLAAESMGRIQATRLYNSIADQGVRDMLSFMIARDALHQNQWMRAIEELLADGLEEEIVPGGFPKDQEHAEGARQYWALSEGGESAKGRWSRGPVPGGRGEVEYLANPAPLGPKPTPPPQPDERLYVTTLKDNP